MTTTKILKRTLGVLVILSLIIGLIATHIGLDAPIEIYLAFFGIIIIAVGLLCLVLLFLEWAFN